ncbi:Kalirin [Heterocephalus glaber]|uniref:Kalirin n=1 Tax=Heterocephalus glaber TaxID=10181 RepID=G5BHQ8_HETGA|nr:Kalirin [Heterocephalus glaber]
MCVVSLVVIHNRDLSCSSEGSFRNDGLKASDVLPILKEKVAFVSGGRDKRGGPILTFPARSNHDRIRQDDLRKLVTYLASVPSEDVCKRGFTVIIDMRGSKWDLIKPLLKTLQEAFPAEIHVALIIKPDNFWQKQKTNFGSSKFIFETSMVSVEGLTKLVDPSQLTEEFDGSLDYNHEEWIELRLSLEEFFNSAVHLLSRLEDLQEMLARKEFPVDVEGSRRLIDEHTQLKKKVLKAPVEELDREGQRLLQCIRCSDGFSGRNCIPGSADFQSLVPKITSLLDKLHSTRQHLHQMWHVRKLKLDQCFQLRLFEQDAEKISSLSESMGTSQILEHWPSCLPSKLSNILTVEMSGEVVREAGGVVAVIPWGFTLIARLQPQVLQFIVDVLGALLQPSFLLLNFREVDLCVVVDDLQLLLVQFLLAAIAVAAVLLTQFLAVKELGKEPVEEEDSKYSRQQGFVQELN